MVKLQNGHKLRPVFRKVQFLGPLLFLVYTNDSPERLTSNVKLFADDTSIFLVVHDSRSSSLSLNEDLPKVSQWGYKWKMLFNPDASKQAQFYFNNILLNRKKYSKTSRAIFRCYA